MRGRDALPLMQPPTFKFVVSNASIGLAWEVPMTGVSWMVQRVMVRLVNAGATIFTSATFDAHGGPPTGTPSGFAAISGYFVDFASPLANRTAIFLDYKFPLYGGDRLLALTVENAVTNMQQVTGLLYGYVLPSDFDLDRKIAA